MKKLKKQLNDYVYIRLNQQIKERIRELSALDGSNMTIWIRQLIKKELDSLDKK